MGRRSARPDAVPRLRVRKRGTKTWYYYDHGGKPRREEPLGCDYGLAIKRWAEIERANDARPAKVITFRYVADRYRAEVIPTKSPGTQIDNAGSMVKLLEFFDDPPGPLEAIEPQHVRQYMRWRSKTAKVRANRDKALLSHIWNWAREQGYTKLPNPCSGVKGFPEPGRDVYVEDDVYTRALTAADAPTRDALELAYLTGQRPADTLKMDERDVRDGVLHVRQNKTKAKQRMRVEGQLAQVLQRIATRKAGYKVRSTRLVINERGQPLGKNALRYRFDKLRRTLGIPFAEFQFRDLRAKAGTDKADSSDIRHAQQQLGHASVTMTEHYVRRRRGDFTTPTK